ncbi:MAG TPA: GNAT family N-acetyltransferase [Myxococcota bacterium]|jgi:phosphinothricin acetyltransferase
MTTAPEAALRVRRAERGDLARITEIYNHYIETTPITFDVKPYAEAEREPWFAQFAASGRYQLFVAERAGCVIGYAGSLPYRPKAAYETSAEMTIYVAQDERARGVGPRLYDALFSALRGEDVHRLLAGITLPNDASVRLHERLGFELVGVYSEVGRKLGRYWDVGWWQRPL